MKQKALKPDVKFWCHKPGEKWALDAWRTRAWQPDVTAAVTPTHLHPFPFPRGCIH